MTSPDLTEAMHTALGYQFGSRVNDLATEQASAVQILAAFCVEVAGAVGRLEERQADTVKTIATVGEAVSALNAALNTFDARLDDLGARVETLRAVIRTIKEEE